MGKQENKEQETDCVMRAFSEVCSEGEARVKTISKPPLMRENNLPQVTEHFTLPGRLFFALNVR